MRCPDDGGKKWRWRLRQQLEATRPAPFNFFTSSTTHTLLNMHFPPPRARRRRLTWNACIPRSFLLPNFRDDESYCCMCIMRVASSLTLLCVPPLFYSVFGAALPADVEMRGFFTFSFYKRGFLPVLYKCRLNSAPFMRLMRLFREK